MTYKLVARCPINKTQFKKWIYDTEDKFFTYSMDIVDRYTNLNWQRGIGYDVEVYKMVNDKYEFEKVYKAIKKEIL